VSFNPIDLPWLPDPPEGFRQLCRTLTADQANAGAEVQRLATHRLDATQSATLSRAINRLAAEGANLAPLSPFRLGVASSATFDFLADVLPAAAARHGVALELVVAPLDQAEQQAFDPNSEINAGRCDGVLVAIDHRWLGLEQPTMAGDAATRVEAALARLGAVAGQFAANAGGQVIVCSAGVPPHGLFGSYDRRFGGSVRRMVEAFNAALPDLCAETGAALFDVAALVEQVGSSAWFDAAFYNLYKLPFTPDAAVFYADALGRLIGALRGKARKCLVLDLDNTCWGGVIGDDGLEGIRIGAGSAEGECFAAVQQAALMLKARGVILAVSSKNDDEVARGPFRSHPDMLLKEGDIAVFQANWQDKPSNLEAIAQTLEIGLDALVFLDDNAAERAQVRAALPMVAVPELPSDAALYAATLLSAGYFEAVGFSEEDRTRSDSYVANAQRSEVKSRARDLGDYLRDLDMRISHAPFDALNRSRIAQLINKSNQFNLTTRRYTEAQVAALETSATFTLQTRLADRFGDFGMIGVVIAQPAEVEGEPAWEVDTWLMSCRVLGRKVEEAMLGELVAAARAAGVRHLAARYIPTAKNGMVSEHFDKLGFSRVGEDADGGRAYVLELAGFSVEPGPFVAVAAE
jgi:FkbH-like protein